MTWALTHTFSAPAFLVDWDGAWIWGVDGVCVSWKLYLCSSGSRCFVKPTDPPFPFSPLWYKTAFSPGSWPIISIAVCVGGTVEEGSWVDGMGWPLNSSLGEGVGVGWQRSGFSWLKQQKWFQLLNSWREMSAFPQQREKPFNRGMLLSGRQWRCVEEEQSLVVRTTPSLWPPLSALLHLHKPHSEVALFMAPLCTCVNVVTVGSGKGESKLAETGMWVLRADDGLDSGRVSDVLMGNYSSFSKMWAPEKRPQSSFADGEASNKSWTVPGWRVRGWAAAWHLECGSLFFIPGTSSSSGFTPFQ